MKKFIWLGLLLCLSGRGFGQAEKSIGVASAAMMSLGHRVMVDRWVFEKEVPSLFKKDGVYLGSALLAQISLPITILNWQGESYNRRWGKEVYFFSLLLASGVGGMNDAIIWRKKYPSGGLAYYTANAMAAVGPTAAMCYWQPEKKNGLLITASALLAGSVVWDWVFCANEPIPNWYGGWGVKTKKERAYFDLSRLVLSGVFYFFSPANTKKEKEDVPFVFNLSSRGASLEIKF